MVHRYPKREFPSRKLAPWTSGLKIDHKFPISWSDGEHRGASGATFVQSVVAQGVMDLQSSGCRSLDRSWSEDYTGVVFDSMSSVVRNEGPPPNVRQ